MLLYKPQLTGSSGLYPLDANISQQLGRSEESLQVSSDEQALGSPGWVFGSMSILQHHVYVVFRILVHQSALQIMKFTLISRNTRGIVATLDTADCFIRVTVLLEHIDSAIAATTVLVQGH